MAMEFLRNGIVLLNESGIFMAFEEKTEELIVNVNSLGFDLEKHLAENKIYLEQVRVSQAKSVETGKYSIESPPFEA
jgi:circadian clock protein KaiC